MLQSMFSSLFNERILCLRTGSPLLTHCVSAWRSYLGTGVPSGTASPESQTDRANVLRSWEIETRNNIGDVTSEE